MFYGVIEGADYVGKTETSRIICERLKADGYNVIRFAEPSNEDCYGASADIRKLITKHHLDSVSTGLLMMAARNELFSRLPKDPDIIRLSDRSFYTTYAYQNMNGDKETAQVLRMIHEQYLKIPFPDVEILLTVNREQAIERSKRERPGTPMGWLDELSLNNHQKLQQRYKEVMSENVFVIDTSHRTIEQVADLAYLHIQEHLAMVAA
ncbi:hypothetical protein KFS98_003591 [Salmonella enterica]|nr:hypothetical protein [Salmonella enterica]